MRRGLLLCLIVAGIAVAPAAAATKVPPRASLQGFVCERAPDALDRAIALIGVMRPVRGTRTMEMKFVLLRRSSSGASFLPVQGGDLGRWRQAKPRTGLYRVKKLVANLPGPAVYQFAVTFRWIGARGAVLNHSTLFSARCYEP